MLFRSISIPSNIAEGMGRMSTKEQVHFLEIAFGSLNEVMCQLEIAYELGFINSEQLSQADERISVIAQMLSGLRSTKLESVKGR